MNTHPVQFCRAALCAVTLACAVRSQAQLKLTNSPPWNGSDLIFPFGEPSMATFGQVFTADATNTLMNSFEFDLKSDAGASVDFRGFVSEWDGSKLTGPLLFASGAQTLPAGTTAFHAYSFDTGGLQLTAGSLYVAFLSASDDFNNISGTAALGITVTPDTYAGGDLVFANNGSDFSALSTSAWTKLNGLDLAFTMQFSPESGGGAVPESSAIGIIGAIALVTLAGFRSFRRA